MRMISDLDVFIGNTKYQSNLQGQFPLHSFMTHVDYLPSRKEKIGGTKEGTRIFKCTPPIFHIVSNSCLKVCQECLC